MDILVEYEKTIKMITIAKSSTIWRLRKYCMDAFDLQKDFTIHNYEMKRDITYT